RKTTCPWSDSEALQPEVVARYSLTVSFRTPSTSLIITHPKRFEATPPSCRELPYTGPSSAAPGEVRGVVRLGSGVNEFYASPGKSILNTWGTSPIRFTKKSEAFQGTTPISVDDPIRRV